MLKDRIHSLSPALGNSFLKERIEVTCSDPVLEDWLVEHIDPSTLSEKYLVVLQTTHTHIHFSEKLTSGVLLEAKEFCDLEKLKKEFNERADRWERESAIHSSPGERFIHGDYLRIIGKGEQVVPFILKRLSNSKKDWLFALENIVPEDENPAKGINSFKDAVKAWLDWGKVKYRSNE